MVEPALAHGRALPGPEPRWRVLCERLSVERGGFRVLEDISLTFYPGEACVIIGPNGAGKTTLLLTLLGILKPTRGAVRFNKTDVCALPGRARGRYAAYVPQTVERLPAYTVYDVVASGRFPHANPLAALSAADRRAIDDAMRRADLAAIALRPISAVSGGERQKALIAAAMAQDAEVMFLDEPTTALDPGRQIELVALLRGVCERGHGPIVVSHDLQLPAVLGGRVIALSEGRVVADGPAAEVLRPDVLGPIYRAPFSMAVTAQGRAFVTPGWDTPEARHT